MNNETNQNELYHYGVKGMRWGIRRARKKLNVATTSEERAKALRSLQKHHAKAIKKVNKLESQHPKLEKRADQAKLKSDPKIAKLEGKSARLARRAHGLLTSKDKAGRLLYKKAKLDRQISTLKASSDKAKAEIVKNERMTELFKKGINEIDEILVAQGRVYVEG